MHGFLETPSAEVKLEKVVAFEARNAAAERRIAELISETVEQRETILRLTDARAFMLDGLRVHEGSKFAATMRANRRSILASIGRVADAMARALRQAPEVPR